jgi:hypothetical protein
MKHGYAQLGVLSGRFVEYAHCDADALGQLSLGGIVQA